MTFFSRKFRDKTFAIEKKVHVHLTKLSRLKKSEGKNTIFNNSLDRFKVYFHQNDDVIKKFDLQSNFFLANLGFENSMVDLVDM